MAFNLQSQLLFLRLTKISVYRCDKDVLLQSIFSKENYFTKQKLILQHLSPYQEPQIIIFSGFLDEVMISYMILYFGIKIYIFLHQILIK